MTQSAPLPGAKRRGRCSREVRKLIDAITAAGGEVRPTNNCHYQVYVEGQLVATLAGTPSEYRGLKNDIARLRRAGLPLTSKGTYRP